MILLNSLTWNYKSVFRGLVFQHENNGVIKRDEVDKIVKSIPQEEKKIVEYRIKIGRYHIYLPKMLKPKAVEFR